MASARRVLGHVVFAVFLLVYAAFFFGSVDGRLEGDDHIALSHAGAMMAGDRLNVDFFDPGIPLQVALSFLGQAAFGVRTLPEVLLALTIRLTGFTALYLLVRRISGSALAGVAVATLVAVLLLHEAVYSAEKLALYPIAMLAAWRYLDGRLSPYALSLVAAVAALWRHDHGVYVGLTMAAAVGAGPQPWRALARLAGGTLVLLAPWLVWIQATEGVPSYLMSRFLFAVDNGLGVERPFGFAGVSEWNDTTAALWLWHVAVGTTVAGLVTGIVRRSTPMVVLAIMSALTAFGLMRKPGQAAEVAAVWIPLFVWLLRDWRWYGRAALAAVATITVVAAFTVSHALEELPQIAGESGGLRERVPRAFRFHATAPPIDGYAPKDETFNELLIARYLYECLGPRDRVWETTMWYPLAYYPQRRSVWHLHWDHGLKHDEPSQRRFLGWIAHEQAPVIVTRGYGDPLEPFRHYDLIRPYVAEWYREVSSPRFDEFRERYRVRLLFDRRRTPTGRYEPLDLPCYGERSS